MANEQAERVKQVLWIFENNPPEIIAALKVFAPNAWAEMMRELREFEASQSDIKG